MPKVDQSLINNRNFAIENFRSMLNRYIQSSPGTKLAINDLLDVIEDVNTNTNNIAFNMSLVTLRDVFFNEP